MNSPVTEQNRLHLDTVDGPERNGIRREVPYNTLFRMMSLWRGVTSMFVSKMFAYIMQY